MKYLAYFLKLACLLALLAPLVSQASEPPESADERVQTGDPISDRWLQRLESRLWPPSPCSPGCVHLAQADLSIRDGVGLLSLEAHVQKGTFLLALPFSAEWSPQTILLDGKPAPVRLNHEGKPQILLSGGVHQIEMSGKPTQNSLNFSFPVPLYRLNTLAINGWTLQQATFPVNSLSLSRTVADRLSAGQQLDRKQSDFPLFARLTRTLSLRESGWHVNSRLTRLSPAGYSKEIAIPLLPGEKILTSGIEARSGLAQIRFAASDSEIAWDATLQMAATLKLKARPGFDLAEVWMIDAANRYDIQFNGLPQAFGERSDQAVFLPFPGESLDISIALPKPVAGPDWAIESTRLSLKPGDDRQSGTLAISLRSLSAQEQTVEFPAQTRIRALRINSQPEPADWRDNKLFLQLRPGAQEISIDFETPGKLSWRTESPQIRLGGASVNSVIEMHIPYSRWPLIAFGPTLGPAILIWGLLAFIVVVALVLRRFQPGHLLRLSVWEWLALLAPLCVLEAWQALLAVMTILALQAREKLDPATTGRLAWNITQLILAILSLSFLLALIAGVKIGLLGVPNMLVTGAGSSNWHWIWYQDRQGADFTQAGMISIPMWVWRALMLVWAFWIASRLMHWSRLAWQIASLGGLWRPGEPRPPRKTVRKG